MHYFILLYLNIKHLHVSSRLAAHRQEDQLCIDISWYSYVLCWLAAGRIGMDDYTNCCLYRVEPPDDEKQTYSKHVQIYYWDKWIENSAFDVQMNVHRDKFL